MPAFRLLADPAPVAKLALLVQGPVKALPLVVVAEARFVR